MATARVRIKLGGGVAVAVALAFAFVGGHRLPPSAEASEVGERCVEGAALARSVVAIARYFGGPRRDHSGREIVGERATAWFYTSDRYLVTAAHFASDIAQGWHAVELSQAVGEGEPDVWVRSEVRVVHVGKLTDSTRTRGAAPDVHARDLAILELREPFPDARVLDTRTEPPSPGEPVLVPAYPDGRLRFAQGIVREDDQLSAKYGGLSLLEVHGTNRLLLNGGASGAPVLDCRRGRVVAVLNGLLTGPALPMPLPKDIVVPTPWGSPTNTAVPVSILESIKNQSL
jgi:hypothetical protein